ncbi:Stk1 family PASTA domain-containing Ser/Thr kinase [Brevibacillus massiliensis]|jgi:serine/threonine-protein kinase|uniref:Stk1 family PASTA domain-containing Ser/Thr kinase n=1 Tax=Brevibacillus massiliensis TaxID=1118054 RepID=UPI00037A03BD|nr:Stk1 family PASTA domain-containing Ser/Thr kinase [Brevibacillus massiliensis]
MENRQLGGRYQLERRVGGGGMAVVYKAKDLVLNRPVAVKVLRPQFSVDEDFVQRFRREAQAVASLSHPNVVGVYDVGQEDDTHYMVMEYIEGSTLKEVINAHGALPVKEAVRIASKICDALDHAHQNHIIHRDIKPHNILIGKNGQVKVTDFGIARAVTSATITHTGAVLGSVHYFSPEQARGGVTAEKSDIYSLGIVLYEMVTGQLPFSGDSPISVALKHLQEPLPEPREINPEIPQSVENVILRALMKDPFMRYASAEEMLHDLETCLSPERLNEPKVAVPTDDEETRVLPAITPEMLEQVKQERHFPQRARAAAAAEEEDEEEDPPRSPANRKKWLIRSAVWAGAAVLFVVLVLVGINILNGILEVPETDVPPVEGMTLEQARKTLEAKHLVPNLVEENNEAEQGTVFRQDPSPPMRVKENSTVTLYVSKGPAEVPMDKLVGLDRDQAESLLKQKGFNLDNVKFTEREDSQAPVGQVIDQSPGEGVSVIPSRAEVKVVVSKGVPMTTMPGVIGKTVELAEIDLLKAKLAKADEVKYQPSFEPKGKVIGTFPYNAGDEVPQGSKVTLIVSNGEYPADAKTGDYQIYIDLNFGETAEIKIVVSDARGDNQVAWNQTIYESTGFNVPLVLAPNKNGKIVVYKNGTEYQSYNVDYQNF